MRYKELEQTATITQAVASANRSVAAGTAARLVTIVATHDGKYVAIVETT